MLRWLPWIVVVTTASVAQPAKAQEARGVDTAPPKGREQIGFVRSQTYGRLQAAAGQRSLVLTAIGGSLGAAAGMGAVLLLSDCGVDDLACDILTVGIGGAAGVLGATIGTTLVARQMGTEHSVMGAAVGAILGTAAGLGLHYLINRNSDRNLGDAIVLPIFAVSQGLLAAIGGRR